ncbi:MAG: cupin domain-containing protein [Hyphomonadaceae bacterium]
MQASAAGCASGDAAGLTQFGVNLVTLDPGVWSSQRHWHAKEDEFVYMLEGELVLVTDAGEEIMRAGDSAGFKAGVRDGHVLQNRSDKPARFLVVGGRDADDWGEYFRHRHEVPARALFRRRRLHQEERRAAVSAAKRFTRPPQPCRSAA